MAKSIYKWWVLSRIRFHEIETELLNDYQAFMRDVVSMISLDEFFGQLNWGIAQYGVPVKVIAIKNQQRYVKGR